MCLTVSPIMAGVIMAPAFQPSELMIRDPTNIITVAEQPTILL